MSLLHVTDYVSCTSNLVGCVHKITQNSGSDCGILYVILLSLSYDCTGYPA